MSSDCIAEAANLINATAPTIIETANANPSTSFNPLFPAALVKLVSEFKILTIDSINLGNTSNINENAAIDFAFVSFDNLFTLSTAFITTTNETIMLPNVAQTARIVIPKSIKLCTLSKYFLNAVIVFRTMDIRFANPNNIIPIPINDPAALTDVSPCLSTRVINRPVIPIDIIIEQISAIVCPISCHEKFPNFKSTSSSSAIKTSAAIAPMITGNVKLSVGERSRLFSDKNIADSPMANANMMPIAPEITPSSCLSTFTKSAIAINDPAITPKDMAIFCISSAKSSSAVVKPNVPNFPRFTDFGNLDSKRITSPIFKIIFAIFEKSVLSKISFIV